jgi:hypothetical protein
MRSVDRLFDRFNRVQKATAAKAAFAAPKRTSIHLANCVSGAKEPCAGVRAT